MPKELRINVAEVPDFGGRSRPRRASSTRVRARPRRCSNRTPTASPTTLKKVPGAVDVDTTLILGKPELRVSIDRDRAADLGVSVADVASTLQLLVGGIKVSTYAESGEQYDIRVRADEQYRADAERRSRCSTVPSTQARQRAAAAS